MQSKQITYLRMTEFLGHTQNILCLQCRKNMAIHVIHSFPVAQMVEHGASNAKIMGSIPRESKSR